MGIPREPPCARPWAQPTCRCKKPSSNAGGGRDPEDGARAVRALALALLAFAGCAASPQPGAVEVAPDFAHPAGKVSERFLSLAIDSALLTGGEVWGPAGDE